MKTSMKNSRQREAIDTTSILTASSHGGKRIRLNKSGHQIFRELARKSPDFFEILGRRDYARKRDAIRSQTYLHGYGDDIEELSRIDSRLCDLDAEIRRVRIVQQKVSWMNTRNTQMEYDSAVQSRERVLEQSRRKVDAIRRSGIIMIEKVEEFRMFKKVRDEVGLDRVRIAVLVPREEASIESHCF